MAKKKQKWVVTVQSIKPGLGWDFPKDYFPRKFYYKRDAKTLRDEAERKGGQGVFVKGA